MDKKIIRTDPWKLQTDKTQGKQIRETARIYRKYVQRLVGVAFIHTEIWDADNAVNALEALIHRSKKNNGEAKYARFFDDVPEFAKFPSGYRRAAIQAAIGIVRSFNTRYMQWQYGDRQFREQRPPRLTAATNINPPLYHNGTNATIRFSDEMHMVSIKVWNGKDWIWSDAMSILSKGMRHELAFSLQKSPYLLSGKRISLGVPFELKPPRKDGDLVCAVDLGMNTAATAVIVDKDGTVYARKFFNRAFDIDHVHKLLKRIQGKASLTGKLHKGFCKPLYSKAYNVLRDMAHQLSRQIVDWANQWNVKVIVFEDMKRWRPKGGRKKSNLKQRFHTWFHRRFVEFTESKWKEIGGKIELVYPRGTSSWAYDGSGKVKRNDSQYELATFKSGKGYNADLNGALNIAARYWAKVLKLGRRNDPKGIRGKSSTVSPRMPVVLFDLWVRSSHSLSRQDTAYEPERS